jgi:hypothetical protein
MQGMKDIKTGNVLWTSLEACKCNHCCHGKASSITYSKYAFVALVTQHAHAMLDCCLCPVHFYHILPHYLINTWFSEKGYWSYNVLQFSLKVSSETSHILRKIQQDIVTNVHTYIHLLLFLLGLNEVLNFSTYFQNLLRYKVSWKSIQWERSYFASTLKIHLGNTSAIYRFQTSLWFIY